MYGRGRVSIKLDFLGPIYIGNKVQFLLHNKRPISFVVHGCVLSSAFGCVLGCTVISDALLNTLPCTAYAVHRVDALHAVCA